MNKQDPISEENQTWVKVPRFNINIRASKITPLIKLRLIFVKTHKSVDVDGHAFAIVKYKVYKHKTYVMSVLQGDTE